MNEMLVIQDQLDAKQHELDHQRELFDELERDKVRVGPWHSTYSNDCRSVCVCLCFRPMWRSNCTRNVNGETSTRKSGASGLALYCIILLHIAMEHKHVLCVCSDAVRYQKKLKVQLKMRDKQIGQARPGHVLTNLFPTMSFVVKEI